MKIITRKQAIELGVKRYFTGNPCPHGHVCERFVSSFTCVECGKAVNGAKSKGVKKHYIFFCEIYKASASCSTRKQFSKNFSGAYLAASRRGILPEITSHMPPPKTSGIWDKENCIKEARKYSSRSDFSRSCPGAYEACFKLGVNRDAFSHMNRRNGDYNVVYMWGEIINGFAFCKVGVTSKRLGNQRFNQVSRSAPVSQNFIIQSHRNDAARIEKKILAIGERLNVGAFSGSTEFRKFTLQKMEEIKNEYFN